jgi:MoaA/NifB/PqqE/SkfB family radical SAM enzyme
MTESSAKNNLKDSIEFLARKSPAFKAVPTLCYLPFMHLEASATGECKQCCMAENPIFKDLSELSPKDQKIAAMPDKVIPAIELPAELADPKHWPLTQEDLTIEKLQVHPDNYYWTHGMYSTIPTVWHLNNSTLSEVFQSNYMKQLRSDFKAGKKPASCKKCWDEEDAGIKSKRIHWAETFCQHSDVSNTIFIDEVTDSSMKYLDLKLGSICNLKCRICGSASSSKWSQDEMDMAYEFENVPKEHLKRTMSYKRLKLGNWPRENDAFWRNLADELLPNIVHLEFTGGESWLIQEHFDFLQVAIDKGYAKNIDLHYNTNGTQLPKHALEEIWPHFKWVKMSFSIDDIGDKFEYQRYGAKWEEVNYNINYLCDNKFLNMTTEICSTISLLNIKSIPDIFEWIRSINVDLWYLNLMHMPNHFNITILPDDYKKIVTDLLTNYNWDHDDLLTEMNFGREPIVDSSGIESRSGHMGNFKRARTLKDGKDYVPDIMSIVEYMNNDSVVVTDGVEKARYQLHDLIYKIDYIRKQKLYDVDPELAEAIGYNEDTMRIAWPTRGDPGSVKASLPSDANHDGDRIKFFKEHGWDSALKLRGPNEGI